MASRSTDWAFAVDFKGLFKRETTTAVYFEYRPIAAEVIVNIPALWDDPD